MKQFFYALIFCSLFFFFCTEEPPIKTTGIYSEGVFTINEGVFGQTSGTITHYNRTDGTVTQKIFKEAKIPDDVYILRDRWYTIEEDYGVKLTNRAGVATEGYQSEVDLHKPCHYTLYSMMLDWNGDVMLCVQDWNKKVKMGNIAADSLLNVWKSSTVFKRYRNMLIKGKRILSPCKECNTNGTLHGGKHLKRLIKKCKKNPFTFKMRGISIQK